MNSILDVILYAFQWCNETNYVPISVGDFEFTFTISSILLLPCFAALTIYCVRKVIEIVDG